MDISPWEEFNLMEKEQTPEEGKMSPVKYYTIMRQSKDPKWFRYEMVRYARDNGVKPAARVFNTTPKTVRPPTNLVGQASGLAGGNRVLFGAWKTTETRLGK
jgi:hypothetical protein